jgi:hypothetical protein
MTRTITPDEHRADLLRAFKIGPDDLAANREGRLSPSERRRVGRNALGTVLLAIALALGLAAIMIFAIDKPLYPIQWILCGLLFAVLAAVGSTTGWRARRARRNGTVECLTGPIRLTRNPRSGYHIHVAGRRFLSNTGGRIAISGHTYHVYVASPAKLIVAMDFVS